MIGRVWTGYGAALLAIFFGVAAFAQQSSQPALAIGVRKSARQQWQSRGTLVAGANAAGLRRQAIAQKIKMRSAGAANTLGSGTGWNSLGPFPLPSDASGIGLQDYNWVSGRATAVAIDPNDRTGNTVFVGGAYGGLWKSTNAGSSSPNPSTVTWVPVTDDQPTLAIGAVTVQPQMANPNPNTSVVLAGTGETNSSADSYYGLGILRSADGGKVGRLYPRTRADCIHLPASDSAGLHSAPRMQIWWLRGQVRLQRES